MSMHFNIELQEKFSEQRACPEGSITFSINDFCFSENADDQEKIFAEWSNGAQCFRISVGRKSASFVHSNPSRGALRSVLNLPKIFNPSTLNVFLSWSILNIQFGIQLNGGDVIFGDLDTPPYRLTSLTNGGVAQIGDVGVEVNFFEIYAENQILVEESAINYWELNLKSVEILFSAGAKNADKSENSFFNAALRQLISGFERYIKVRLSELEREGYAFDFEEFSKVALRKKDIDDDLHLEYYKLALDKNRGFVETILQDAKYNINSLKDARKVFNRTYGLDLYKCGLTQGDLQFLDRCFKHRHNLTHRNPLTPSHFYEGGIELFFEDGTRRAKNLFTDLVKSLHKASTELPAAGDSERP